MKSFGSVSFAVILFVFGSVQAQSANSMDPLGRPRTVAAPNGQSSARQPFQNPITQQQTPERVRQATSQPSEQPPAVTKQVAKETKSAASSDQSAVSRHLSPARLRMRIDEAERLMKTRPLPTALTVPSLDYVTLAALLPETSQIHQIRIAKETFLTKGAEFSSITSRGLPVQVRIL